MSNGLNELIQNCKAESDSKHGSANQGDEQPIEDTDKLKESLELLIRRNNPMSDAAKKALERL